MTGRERYIEAVNHREPDRVPIDLGGWQSGMSFRTYEEVKKVLGVDEPTKILELNQGLGVIDEVVLEKFEIDTRYIFPAARPSDNPFEKQEDSYVDEWGLTWRRPESSVYYDMTKFPLREINSLEELDKFPFPDPSNLLSKEELVTTYESLKGKKKAIFTSLSGCFEQATYIRGMEQYYMDAYLDPDYFAAVMDKVLEVLLPRYTLFFDAVGEHLDLVEFWGDLGTQIGPMVSPELYKSVIMPKERQLVDLVKSKTNAKAALHTCGSSYAFIPDIIEAGYEIINPVQVTAVDMDPIRLKKEFGNDLTFWGGIDTQQILPFGTPQQVSDEVKRIIDIMAPGGGFILAPVHNIQAFTPPENVIALFETAIEYGVY